MIKNKLLRFVINLVVSIASIIIVSVAFEKADKQGLLAFGTLFSIAIWLLFMIQRDLLGEAGNVLTRLLRNIFIVAMIAVALIGVIVGLVLYFNTLSHPDESPAFLLATTLLSPVITFLLALFLSQDDLDTAMSLTPYATLAVAAASLLLSLVLTIVTVVSTIAVIVFAVGSIAALVFAIKKGWLEFESLHVSRSRSSYSYSSSGSSSYSSYSYSSSSSSSGSTKSSSGSSGAPYSSPSAAMDAIASKCSSHSCQLTGLASFLPRVSCSVSGGAANFVITGEVRMSGINITQSDVNEAKNALNRYLKEIADDIDYEYDRIVPKMVQHGIDCSSIETLRVNSKNITIST